MTEPKEIRIQEIVIKYLMKSDIFPFSVIYTNEVGDNTGTLGVTLYNREQLDELLDRFNYKSRCDKTGYTIIEDTNTILFSGMALLDLYIKLF